MGMLYEIPNHFTDNQKYTELVIFVTALFHFLLDNQQDVLTLNDTIFPTHLLKLEVHANLMHQNTC